MGRFLVTLLLVGLILPGSGRATEDEVVSSLADQTGVHVTVYNEDLALVKDARQIVLPIGESVLAFREVSGRLRPETSLLRSVRQGDTLSVIEQNFDFDLLTPKKILEKYVGKKVGIVRSHPTTGEETVTEALVLSANSGVVLKVGDRIETGLPGRLIFPDVPKNLRDRPTLSMLLVNRAAGLHHLELSYLTRGLGWRADYVAELDSAETGLDLNGWVTLTNTSGATYKNAHLQLMAGEVNQVAQQPRRDRYAAEKRMLAAAKSPAMAEESLMDYHLYSLARPTTIGESQSKQVALLQASGVACGKEYLLAGQQHYYQGPQGPREKKEKVAVFLSFANTREARLGQPLPAGIVRVYKKDKKGSIQFVGEDRIDHVPENEAVRLRIGSAFDVTAQRTQTDFKKLAGFSGYNYVFESGHRVDLKNGRDQEVVVRVEEPLPGDWQIVSESLPHEKQSAARAAWKVRVPAKGSTTLTYRVRVKH